MVFEMDLEAHLNISLKDFVIWPSVEELFVRKTQVKVDNIGMFAHDYDKTFTSVL